MESFSICIDGILNLEVNKNQLMILLRCGGTYCIELIRIVYCFVMFCVVNCLLLICGRRVCFRTSWVMWSFHELMTQRHHVMLMDVPAEVKVDMTKEEQMDAANRRAAMLRGFCLPPSRII